ncbi:MAG TPA: histidine kinase dimerization/phospho-acceptor domain-containing protein, partial [Candidatus Peribacteria bacterium]|nr:histidine kinase dimerization/phospho-acceptor domain-containing protein [Candidatus Peribacteria bacterium]
MTPRQTPPNGSLRRTLFLETSVLLAFAVILTVTAAFFLARNEMRSRAAAQVQSIIHAKEELLENVTSGQREQVAELAKDASLTRIPSVTNIIGFQGLFAVKSDGTSRTLVGSQPSAALLESVAALRGADSTRFVASISPQRGWESYAIVAPMHTGEKLVATFSADPLLGELLSVDELGDTTDVLLGANRDGDLLLLHQARGSRTASPLDLGGYEAQLSKGSVLAKAIDGREGIEQTSDYAGIGVLAAYRSMPSIGWGLVVQIDRHEIDAPLIELSLKLLAAGAALILLLSLTMYSLAQRITAPLLDLTHKLEGLEARNWRFSRSIYTGDEIERLDDAAFDLTGRLRQSHDHLEELVRTRTRALMEQVAQDDAILQSMEYGLIVTDANGAVTLVNGAAELLTGWSQAEAAGKSCDIVLHVVDHEEKPVTGNEHPVMGVLTAKEAYAPSADPQLALKRKDGTAMPLSLRVTPILRGWHCSGTVAIFRDITEERRIDHMKSEFISLVSHQLRTPLSSMRWYLEMLLTKDFGPLNEDQQGYVEQVAASNERMVRLVNALLNVSRIELGTLSADQDTVDPLQMLKEIEKSTARDIEKRKLTVTYDAAGYAAGNRKSDAVLLQLILENLVANAVKYSREGGVIRVELHDTPDGGCSISVSDTGIGIPP